MKQRPMVLIFAGVLSGTAVVWNIMSMTAAFYLLTGICLLASLIFSDRRYGWVVVGILTGILLSLGFKTSMKLDLIQVKEKATEYTMGRVLEVSKTKKGKLAVLLKNKNLEGKILLYTPEDEKNNILGCINIDMVGEKGKGPIIMQTVNGENNIISIMMDKLTNKEFNLSGGGSSDDLSFYMVERKRRISDLSSQLLRQQRRRNR